MKLLQCIGSLLHQLDEAVFPSSLYCLCCGAMIDESRSYSLCDDCIRKFHWITGTTCDVCGKALPDRTVGCGAGARLCYDCLRERPVFNKGFSCVTYGLHERELMMDLKYAGRGYIARKCGDMMFDRIETEIASGVFSPKHSPIDMIVPVPIGSDRGMERGYNQSAIMAAQLAIRWRAFVREARVDRQKQSGNGRRGLLEPDRQEQSGNGRRGLLEPDRQELAHPPVLYQDLLYRTRKTRKLRSLSPAERALELEGAFKVRSRYVKRIRNCVHSRACRTDNSSENSTDTSYTRNALPHTPNAAPHTYGALPHTRSALPHTRGARILLVDDIHTTGSTANACTKALFDAGASEVFFLSWASGGNRKPSE